MEAAEAGAIFPKNSAPNRVEVSPGSLCSARKAANDPPPAAAVSEPIVEKGYFLDSVPVLFKKDSIAFVKRTVRLSLGFTNLPSLKSLFFKYPLAFFTPDLESSSAVGGPILATASDFIKLSKY